MAAKLNGFGEIRMKLFLLIGILFLSSGCSAMEMDNPRRAFATA